MIIVELSVPSIGTSYSIRVNEHQKAGILQDEMLALVRMKTGEADAADADAQTEGYHLFFMQTGERIRRELSMDAQGVKDGSRLMLV